METQKKETLLIVDDSKFQRVILKEMLSESFHLVEATCGQECLDYVEKNAATIDMVLLDLVMPGIDGFEVLRRRQNMPDFKAIPVIVLTTSDSISFQTEAFELGADEFIIKPVDVRIAISRINNALGAMRHLQKALADQNTWKEKSQIDEMTHLFNKTTTESMIQETLKAFPDRCHALMMVDIDNFKSANDIFGHKVGDHIICVIAGVLSSLFGTGDILGRVGGDEFIVMMSHLDSRQQAIEKAGMLVDIVRRKENLSIPENISVSVGLAFSEGEETTSAELFSHADSALYVSKKSGKGRYSVYGEEYSMPENSRTILVWSSSRNVTSTLEFALPDSTQMKTVSSVDDIKTQIAASDGSVVGIYIDVSDRADAGEALWQSVSAEEWKSNCPIIAICKEGELSQIRHAVSSDAICDLLLSPLDASAVKRRIREHFLLHQQTGLEQ